MTRFTRILGLVIVFFTAVGISSAHATSTLLLSDGSTTVLIEDGGPLDSYGADGVVTYIGAVGIFNVNVTTGITYPVLGSLEYPALDLNDVSVSGVQGTLEIKFSQTDFGPTDLTNFLTSVGGTTDGSVSVGTYLDNSNVLFGTQVQLAALGPFQSAFNGDAVKSVDPANPYSITTIANITHNGDGQVSSFDLALQGANPVPEPTSLLLFITGGGLFAGTRLRRKKA